ncbi:MAG: asparagine synthase (glutamine-hydrolyzing) [Bacteroidota bacterium]|jgi:asparagine synthase (glutamine-hydrolysing)
MCGINGVLAFSSEGIHYLSQVDKMNRCLKSRGPDHDGIWTEDSVSLGHRRLAILDTSDAGNQPMMDDNERYVIVFNGEFFNFKDHRRTLESEGHSFRTSTDTEVLLKLFAKHGTDFLKLINGFFALAIYDRKDKSLFLARDRFGIKPLLVYETSDALVFSSEMKALCDAGIPRKIDRISLKHYLHLNYVPGNFTMLQNVCKLDPGTWVRYSLNVNYSKDTGRYYEMPSPDSISFTGDLNEASTRLFNLLDDSVKLRLVSDVPLGAFLSGGIDSSAVVALASRHVKKLNTFSIGFKDEPAYDETAYARMVADKFKTEHTEFKLTSDDLFEELYRVLDYLDDPFADSSALAVQILCNRTSKHVKVALSGDGADEMLGGYNKHRAELMFQSGSLLPLISRIASPLLYAFQGGRGGKLSNIIRQLHRLAEGAQLSAIDRYWRWCGYTKKGDLDGFVVPIIDEIELESRRRFLLDKLGDGSSMEKIFRMDMGLVLPGDMLVKVDMMSMANSLEVRVPFLDYRVVDFAMNLPSSLRIDKSKGKLVLREAFRNELPEELFTRPKHGFEVPLLKWFKTGLKSLITDDLLDDQFIVEQGLFDLNAIQELKNRLYGRDPGDIGARIWGLIVFQYWWKKYQPTL